MKKISKNFGYVILLLVAGTMLYAQETKVDRATVPFSDPSKPGRIEAHVQNGGITVRGYDGKEVIVEARLRGKTLTRKKKENEQAKGMKLISIATTGLSIEEKNNKMEITATSMKNTVDLNIQVPFNTSLEISCHNNGNVLVVNVTGEIEVNHHNGKVTLTNISGAVVAHTFNGSVLVTFNKVDPNKPMSFSTWNGDIDVTFPPDLKANVKMKSQQGDIYCDYEVSLQQTPIKKDARIEGGEYKISFLLHGTINGGGQEIQFNTFHGDIFIRSAK